MNESRLDLPTQIETERLYLRPYRAGDGRSYCAMSQRNRAHLTRYESDNEAMAILSEEEAEAVVRELAADWAAQNCFFLAAFDRQSNEFVAQIYVGPLNREQGEFQIGYFFLLQHPGHSEEACGHNPNIITASP